MKHFGKEPSVLLLRKQRRPGLHTQVQEAEGGVISSQHGPWRIWRALTRGLLGLSERTIKTFLKGEIFNQEANALVVQVLSIICHFVINESQDMVNASSRAHWNPRGNKVLHSKALPEPAPDVCIWNTPGRETGFSTQSSRSGDQHLITWLPSQEAKSNTMNIGSGQKPPHESRTHGFHCLFSHPHRATSFSILRLWPLLCLRKTTSGDAKMNCPAKQCYSQ